MIKWEYKDLVFEVHNFNKVIESGLNGWELVSVVPYEKHYILCIFKRQKQVEWDSFISCDFHQGENLIKDGWELVTEKEPTPGFDGCTKYLWKRVKC